MNNKSLYSLTKKEILTLPGFKEYANELNKHTKAVLLYTLRTYSNEELNLNSVRPTVKQYKQAYNRLIKKQELEERERKLAQLRKEDNEFFGQLNKMKQQNKQQKESRNQYKQSIKNKALNEREAFNDLMNIEPDYHLTKSSDRDYYEKNILNKEEYEKFIGSMMKDAKKQNRF